MQHKITKKIGYPCMEALVKNQGASWNTDKWRGNISELFGKKALKARKKYETGLAKEIEEYCGYLDFLKGIVENDYLESRWFGLEVFLSELDDLFINCIDPLKITKGSCI